MEEIQSQLDFLYELQGDQKNALHIFLEAMLKFKLEGSIDESVELLNQCLKLHIAETKKVSIGFEFYIKLNSAFLLEEAQEYLQHCPSSLKYTNTEAMPPYLVKGIKLLETLSRQTPGIIEAHLLLAKAKWIANDSTAAHSELALCTKMAPDMLESYILASILHKEDGNLTAAFNYLEQALAENFLVKQNPVFLYAKAQLEIDKKEYGQAYTTLESAFELPAIKNKETEKYSRSLILKFGDEERAKMHVMMVVACDKLKKTEDSKKWMQKAISEFAGTPYEVIIILAHADWALISGDIKKALNMLKKIPMESPHFKDARIKMADIYLKQLMDRRHYSKCYMEILKAKESPENYRLAGDALMKIQEPEQAIDLYEKALSSSTDAALVRDIGKALVMTHNYQKAIEYYQVKYHII